MNPSAKKVVLFSENGYSPERDHAFLEELVKRKIELFCVSGKDALAWEDEIDWICVELDFFIITTAHSDETEDDVLEFARGFMLSTDNSDNEIEIIRR